MRTKINIILAGSVSVLSLLNLLSRIFFLFSYRYNIPKLLLLCYFVFITTVLMLLTGVSIGLCLTVFCFLCTTLALVLLVFISHLLCSAVKEIFDLSNENQLSFFSIYPIASMLGMGHSIKGSQSIMTE